MPLFLNTFRLRCCFCRALHILIHPQLSRLFAETLSTSSDGLLLITSAMLFDAFASTLLELTFNTFKVLIFYNDFAIISSCLQSQSYFVKYLIVTSLPCLQV